MYWSWQIKFVSEMLDLSRERPSFRVLLTNAIVCYF